MDQILKKEPAFDDPMELQAVQLDGDPDFMIDCIVEEYARIGWTADRIFRLFESPLYPALHSLLLARGVDEIRRRVERVVTRCGVFRVRTFEAPEAAELVNVAPLTEGGSQE
ncbi:MAG: hypothetical protein HY236_06090 [Acidobacteria bacterium]|nr:hypothetical protein [Acidobacteriota bacterium]